MKHEWKIASINESPWKLFNLEKDPTEAVDLSAERPEKVAELSSAWYRFAKAEARQSDVWNRPLNDSEQGWGYHRLKMVLPLQTISPPSSAMGVRAVTEIVMSFSQPLSFRNTDNRSIRLFEVGQPDSPVYQQDPDPSHPAEGSREFRFGPLPELKPDTTYYLTTDPGWIRVGGTPAGAVNDGSFWYRFRTAAE
jgi:arylsulfatase